MARSAARPGFYYPDAVPDHDAPHGANVGANGGAPADAIVSGSEPEPLAAGPLASERSRLVVTAIVAGAIALLAGWVLGRGGDDTSAQTVDGAPVTTRGPNTTIAGTFLPGDTVPLASAPTTTPGPTTTRPRPTTTTTLPPTWQTSTIEIDPRLAGATDRIVGVDVDGRLVEVDLATGETRTFAVSRGAGGVSVTAGADWVIVHYDDGNAPRVLLDVPGAVRDTRLTAVDDGSSMYWDIGTDRFWTIDFDRTIGVVRGLVAYDVRTGELGPSIDTAGMWPWMADPAGGVVVGDGAVGLFRVTADGSRRLAVGRPIALGSTHVVASRCGESLDDCGVVVVDRVTGDERMVPVDADPGALTGDWWTPPSPLSLVTSDGRYAAVVVPGEQLPLTAVLDTTTGAVTTLEGDHERGYLSLARPTWSSDDRWLFVVIDGVAHAYDPGTGERFPMSPDPLLASIRHVTVRPPA